MLDKARLQIAIKSFKFFSFSAISLGFAKESERERQRQSLLRNVEKSPVIIDPMKAPIFQRSLYIYIYIYQRKGVRYIIYVYHMYTPIIFFSLQAGLCLVITLCVHAHMCVFICIYVGVYVLRSMYTCKLQCVLNVTPVRPKHTQRM